MNQPKPYRQSARLRRQQQINVLISRLAALKQSLKTATDLNRPMILIGIDAINIELTRLGHEMNRDCDHAVV